MFHCEVSGLLDGISMQLLVEVVEAGREGCCCCCLRRVDGWVLVVGPWLLTDHRSPQIMHFGLW